MKTYLVTWSIDVEAESPRAAAEDVWRNQFRRTKALPNDCCVFEVHEEDNTTPYVIDLSENPLKAYWLQR